MTPDALSANQPDDLRDRALAFIENAPTPMAVVEGGSQLVCHANKPFCTLLRRSTDEVVGKRVGELLSELDECVELLARVLRSGKAESHVGECRSGVDSLLWSYAMWPITPIDAPALIVFQVTETRKAHESAVALNEALLLAAIRQDELINELGNTTRQLESEIEARRRISQALAEKAHLLDVTNDAIIARGLDDEIKVWNKGAEKLYGWSANEVVGRDLNALLKTEFPKPQEEIFRELYREGHFAGEVVQVARDGRRIPTFCRWVLDHETQSILTSYTDISELKSAEGLLRESEGRYRTLFTSAPMAVFVCDTDGFIKNYNERAAELWGRQPVCGVEKFCGSFRLWRPDGTELPQEESPMMEVIRSGDPAVNIEVEIERPDESRLPVLANLAALRDADGRITGVITSFMDISERRQLESSLEARAADLVRADRTKDEFLAMLAHELRNPLAPMRNAAEILKASNGGIEEVRMAQTAIDRQIGNMSRMIDDLLDVSRITEGKIELRRETVDLNEIVRSVANGARAAMALRGQKLSVSIPEKTVYVDADPTRIEQVVSNLLGNAQKYCADGCKIEITLDVDTGRELTEAVIRVRDNGMGIAPTLLPRVFDLFVQASRALDRSHGGLGIGLTLVSRLVKLHGGSVEAHSEGLGLGSEFIVRLPVLAGPVKTTPVTSGPPLREAPCRMLVVDDNQDSARSMATLQRLRGHETRMAFTGPEAVEVAAEFLPEVVLLDIGLPGMDGYEVARTLRAMPPMVSAFIVAMSGYGSESDRAQAVAAGIDEYLIKPVDLDLLHSWLRNRS